MPSTTPRQDVRSAFATILKNANLGVSVYERLPYEGAEPRSVILTLVSGSNRSPGIGVRYSATQRAFESSYRLQVDCYHDDKAEADKLADKAEQAIMDRLDTLRSIYDIHDVRKIVDTDTLPEDPLLRQARIVMDFEFYTHRAMS